MRFFFYCLKPLLAFYFPQCQAPEKKEGGEVLNPETKDVL